MIKHFSLAYAYLLILHIFLIFTSFNRIQAQNIFQQNQLYDLSSVQSLDKTIKKQLKPAEKHALYIRQATLDLGHKRYKQALEWSKKIPQDSYFAPLKDYFAYKTAFLQAQEQLLTPLNKSKLKHFKQLHHQAWNHYQQLALGTIPGFRQELALDQKTLLFHNLLTYVIEKKSNLDVQKYLYKTNLDQAQQAVLINAIKVIYGKKKSQSLLAVGNLSDEMKNISSDTRKTTKTLEIEQDISLIRYNSIEKSINAESLKKHAQLMHDFPNSTGAKRSQDDILNASKLGAKSIFLRLYYDINTTLPFDIFYKLGHQLWNQKDYTLAQLSFKKAQASQPFHEKADVAMFYNARIFEDQSKWKEAKNKYLNFVDSYPSSDLNQRAFFKLGLISYILNQESQAQLYFRKHYSLSDSINEKAQSIFWQMRVAEKFNRTEQVKSLRQQLRQETPLSYYAAKENLWPKLSQKNGYNQTITANSVLYQAHLWTITGFHQQALSLLEQLSIDTNKADFALYLNLWHANKEHTTPVILAFKAIHAHEKIQDINLQLLNNVFPTEFSQTITKITQQSDLSPELIFAIIKQESAFNPNAKSPAGAYGLMQLMPNTAKNLFSNLDSTEAFQNELLYQPQINLELGKLYLQKLNSMYNGNLVYLTSNYNAGQTPLKTWQSRWNTLDQDIFIEMIPYKETRDYVKIVLRNFYFYQFLNHKNIDK